MKKIYTLFAAMLMTLAVLAQNPDNPNAKMNMVVGEFTGDHSKEMRIKVIQALTDSYRANIIEESAYNALPQQVRDKMRIDAFITGKCTFKTESKQREKIDKKGNKKTVTEYTSKMTTELSFANGARTKILQKPVFESTSTEENRNESIKNALNIGSTKGKQINLLMVQTLTLDEYLQDKYPLHGKIVTVNDTKKDAAKSVTINLGSRDAVYRSQTFEIVAKNKKGKEDNYGRLRVREINNDSLSTCSVDKGGKELLKAFENGDEIKIVSYVQPVSLNGIVRVEQDAPRLTVSTSAEAMKRNVAFGGIAGNAPSEFVNAIKENLKNNRRINACDLASTPVDKLDGIAYGFYTGMKSSSKLVKAEDHVLQTKDYTEYTTTVNWYLFIVNPKNGEIVYSGYQGSQGVSKKSAEDAKQIAFDNASRFSYATYCAYPLIGTISTVDDSNPDKAKEVSIDLGSVYPVYEGLEFDVYSEDASAGWEKIGRLEVKSVTDADHSKCKVKKGGEKIQKAIEEGQNIRITTYILKEFFEL